MIEKLIHHFGGHTGLAMSLGVSVAAVSQWVTHKKIPAERAIEIEAITAGKFKARDLTRKGRFPDERKPIKIIGDIAEIDLGRGYTAIVDASDVKCLEKYQWHAMANKHTVYAFRNKPKKTKGLFHGYMHRLIMDAPAGMDVDHRDRDGLNNRAGNLRVCTRSVNISNRSVTNIPYRNNTTGYKGVRKSRTAGKWIAVTTIDGKSKHIGTFDNPEDANRAYCEKLDIVKGAEE